MSEENSEKPEPSWVSNFHFLLANREATSILMVPGARGWALPYVQIEGGIWLGETDKVVAAFREKLDATFYFTILRYASLIADEGAKWDQIVWVVECHEELDKPPLDGQWVNRSALATMPLAVAEHRPLLLDYLHTLAENQMPTQRVPWARAGWYREAVAWIEAALVQLGYQQSGSIEQIKQWSISSVLRVPTNQGIVYFKAGADLPLFVNEPVLMDVLGARLPLQVPRPIKIDAPRRWMLMDDFGPGQWGEPVGVVADAMVSFARLQIATAAMRDDLFALGVFDRRLPVLSAQIDELIAHPLAPAKLKPETLTALEAFAPTLKEMCQALAAYRIPATIGHGDMHMGNVARNGDDFLFFDWTDACIMHPFVDIMEPGNLRDDEAALARIRNAYLAQWIKFEPLERLHEAWRLSRPLHALHQSVSYLYILANQEPLVHQELEDGFTRYTEDVVRQVQSSNEV